MPTMWCTVAYIDSSTPRGDVSFHVSRKQTARELGQYVTKLKQWVSRTGAQLLELTVFDGEQEMWRGCEV